MTLRSVLRAARPWRWESGHQRGCPRLQFWDAGEGECPCECDGGRRVLAPWARLCAVALWATALWLVIAWASASRADADATWSRTIQWRSSTVRLVSSCGPLDEAGVVAELEAGRARAVADLGHDNLPPLGTPTDPYIVLAMADPKCPGNALACSGKAPLSRSTWTLVRTRCGAKVLDAIDHEAQHRWAILLTGDTVLGMRADHPADAGFRYDVRGQRVPIAPKAPTVEATGDDAGGVDTEVDTEVVWLNKKQALILSRFPAGWVTPQQVGADAEVLRRMTRKGLLEADSQGRFRMTEP